MFHFEIVEHIATLSDSNGITKELNKISYNGTPAKYDLRSWQKDGRKMLKGLTLTESEIHALKAALSEV